MNAKVTKANSKLSGLLLNLKEDSQDDHHKRLSNAKISKMNKKLSGSNKKLTEGDYDDDLMDLKEWMYRYRPSRENADISRENERISRLNRDLVILI